MAGIPAHVMNRFLVGHLFSPVRGWSCESFFSPAGSRTRLCENLSRSRMVHVEIFALAAGARMVT